MYVTRAACKLLTGS